MEDEFDKLKDKTLTKKELRKICKPSSAKNEEEMERFKSVDEELSEALEIIDRHPRSVSFFGSARSRENNEHYQKARGLAKKIAQRLEYTIVSGGSLGIMEAANRGAKEGGGTSVGFNINLPDEQSLNEYIDEGLAFQYFFTRKVALAFSAEAYLFFPGGFGTLDEFFELITLIQTRKIERVPIILVGNEYWSEIDRLIREHLYKQFGTIDKEDSELYTITEDEDEILEIIKNAPVRKE